ncbi:hypothetical protein DKM44_12830 [Deinococcus irradiatisoli]|uniref:HK97 gp10 family phage protein n=1 Tax=Deinococcus irradiatisoli TaxID=2202254 RepID=A0A2Z3JJ45_9DEIO|nr:hypothetical protein [Deinococcus irradiatisoli]AWN24006.1 hypothetical protein DKM44_12830 [Deinococcus irradiatisoli]
MPLDLNAMRQQALNAADNRAGVVAQQIRNEIVQKLSQPGTGRQYGKHRSSSPGEPPAVDLGDLRRSISAVKIGPGHWQVGTNLAKAPLLELGTRYIKARPFFRPVLERFRVR